MNLKGIRRRLQAAFVELGHYCFEISNILRPPLRDKDDFWDLIERTKQNPRDYDAQLRSLSDELSNLEKAELQFFANQYVTLKLKAYSWDLWGAAYVLNGGCSDDGFDYFRDWLIAQGRDVFVAVLEDPEALVGVGHIYNSEFELFGYQMHNVYKAHFGEELEPDYINYTDTSDDDGEPFDEDTVDLKYPRLAKWVREKLGQDG